MIAENMPKLQSPWKRDSKLVDGGIHYVVADIKDTDFLWVFEDPEVYAMEKLDGTNMSVVIQDGKLIQVWNRKNLVSNLVDDEWEHIKDFGHILEAIKNSTEQIENLPDGQHFGECIGLGIQHNPMDIPDKRWVPFNTYGKENMVYDDWKDIPKDFESMSKYMKNLKSKYYAINHDGKEEYAEGLVLYRPSTGDRVKLRRDMYDWWITDNVGVINKHVNVYNKKPKKVAPTGMAGEFSLISKMKQQGLMTAEEFDSQKVIILEKYGIKA